MRTVDQEMEKLAEWLRVKGTLPLKADDQRDFQVSYPVYIGWQEVDPNVVKYAWEDVKEYAEREDTNLHIWYGDYGLCHLYSK